MWNDDPMDEEPAEQVSSLEEWQLAFADERRLAQKQVARGGGDGPSCGRPEAHQQLRVHVRRVCVRVRLPAFAAHAGLIDRLRPS